MQVGRLPEVFFIGSLKSESASHEESVGQRFGFKAGWSSSLGGEAVRGVVNWKKPVWLEGFCYSNGQSRASDFLFRRSSLSHSVKTSGLSRASTEQWQLLTQGLGLKKTRFY